MSNLLKLFLFICLLLGHMYFYDPSLMTFLSNVQQLSHLQFNDSFLLNSIIWVIGVWGMILFMNSNNILIKVASWLLFLGTTSIQFGYVHIFKESFNLNNTSNLPEFLDRISSIESMELMKFIAITGIFLVVSLIIKPVAPQITGVFLVLLFALISLITIAHKGSNIVLPTFYLVPVLLVYDSVKDIFTLSNEPLETKKAIAPVVLKH